MFVEWWQSVFTDLSLLPLSISSHVADQATLAQFLYLRNQFLAGHNSSAAEGRLLAMWTNHTGKANKLILAVEWREVKSESAVPPQALTAVRLPIRRSQILQHLGLWEESHAPPKRSSSKRDYLTKFL